MTAASSRAEEDQAGQSGDGSAGGAASATGAGQPGDGSGSGATAATGTGDELPALVPDDDDDDAPPESAEAPATAARTILILTEPSVTADELYLTMIIVMHNGHHDIWTYHEVHGFPVELAHHKSKEVPRRLSHLGDYDDWCNWTGSMLIWAWSFLAEAYLPGFRSIMFIFDQEGWDRSSVYKEWSRLARSPAEATTMIGITSWRQSL